MLAKYISNDPFYVIVWRRLAFQLWVGVCLLSAVQHLQPPTLFWNFFIFSVFVSCAATISIVYFMHSLYRWFRAPPSKIPRTIHRIICTISLFFFLLSLILSLRFSHSCPASLRWASPCSFLLHTLLVFWLMLYEFCFLSITPSLYPCYY